MDDIERFLRDGIQRALDTVKDPRLDAIPRETLAHFVAVAATGEFLEHFAAAIVAQAQAKNSPKQ